MTIHRNGWKKMLVNSVTKLRTEKRRYKQEYMSPNSKTRYLSKEPSDFYSLNNYQDIKRPLKTNQSDLSFKGLSSVWYKKLDKVYSKKEFLEFARKYVGKTVTNLEGEKIETSIGEELLESVLNHPKMTSKLIKIEGDNITLYRKTIPHLAWDGIKYPFTILPFDILNGTVKLLGKIPGLGKISERILDSKAFRMIRQRSKMDAKVNSLRGLITFRDVKLEEAAKKAGKSVSELSAEEIAKVDKSMESSIFKTELKMFDPKSGNYDTKHERALNRLVSGLPPAIFLATDAYNLSRMMDDDSQAADKERKIRFRQETSRILTSGYLTLITMGAFQKFINKSKMGIVLTTGITVLVTEMFSRLSNGKHIKRLTPEEARRENEKTGAPEFNIKPVVTQKNVSSTGSPAPKEHEKQQKPLLSFDTLVKASAVVLGVGYGIKGLKNIPAIRKSAYKILENIKTKNPERYNKLDIEKSFEAKRADYRELNPDSHMSDKDIDIKNSIKMIEDKIIYRPFTQLYKKLTTENYHVEVSKFNEIVELLRTNGFEKLADKYEKVGRSAIKKIKINETSIDPNTGAKIVREVEKEIVDLGKKDKKIKPLVNFIIAPFKFTWNTITLPYWMIDEKLLNVFRKKKVSKKTSDIEALAHSFEKLSMQAHKKNFSKEQFQDWVQVNLLKAFNADSLSSVSNAELSNLAKTAATMATIYFLMTDNYNMVMLKSNGNDVDGANTKFKERFVQEGSRLFYQTLLIDLFNSTFRNQYNASLLGMSVITVVDTTLGEMLTRKSVGTPLKAHTRDELIDMETKRDNATGFLKGYYNFMQRLTGKRSIKSYEVKQRGISESKTPTIPTLTANKDITFSQGNILTQIIKGDENIKSQTV